MFQIPMQVTGHFISLNRVIFSHLRRNLFRCFNMSRGRILFSDINGIVSIDFFVYLFEGGSSG